MFWEDDELSELAGTEAEGMGESDRDVTRADWEGLVAPALGALVHAAVAWVGEHGWGGVPGATGGAAAAGLAGALRSRLDLPAYRRAASLVASRSFGVDHEHLDSMVPVADLFNHKASIVDIDGDWEVHQHAYADSSDGDEADERSGAEAEGSGAEAEGGGGGDPTAPRKDPRLAADPSLALEIAICDRGDWEHPSAFGRAFPGALEIVAARDLAAGQEIHNTYGEHGNAALLRKYAFCLEGNPFTEVPLDKGELVEHARALFLEEFAGADLAGLAGGAGGRPRKRARGGDGAAAAATLEGWWERRLGFVRGATALLDVDGDGDEVDPAVVYAGGYVNATTPVLLFALTQGPGAEAGWGGAGPRGLLGALAAAVGEGGWAPGSDPVVHVAEVRAAVGPRGLALLSAAAARRGADARYGRPLAEDRARLAAARAEARACRGPLPDALVARLGARALRVSEREALRDISAACA